MAVFGGDIFAYLLNCGNPELESKLIKALGIRYAVAEWVFSTESIGKWLMFRNHQLERVAIDRTDFVPVTEFLANNSEYLYKLVKYFEENTHGL